MTDSIVVQGVTKTFGTKVAVDRLDLTAGPHVQRAPREGATDCTVRCPTAPGSTRDGKGPSPATSGPLRPRRPDLRGGA